ncbi:hypothetical protein BK133_11270 [Paenibacillus sp. FSL H8-0548]|uniref:hypothetical protein n=1 Tax=Paenibacillus sp. FSL H8-0548 TaxID=1920422 RepID=UPI00096D8B7D|nr:hypothetical protein [Paenibacillus sp. FSL H8-0548]OMF35276.1 hypothetical protein BK133_11270 [Paenibacillus sp. FSL H8-0548]
MTARNQNFVMYAGDTVEIEVPVANTDLTGVTIKWAMKRSVKGDNTLYRETPSGIEITDAAAGIFMIKLESIDTKDLIGSFYHEAELMDAIGNVSTIMTGTITIKPSGV